MRLHRPALLLPLLLPSLLLPLLLSLSPSLTSAAPFSVSDSYGPPCGLLSEPPPGGWKLWSSASTWARSTPGNFHAGSSAGGAAAGGIIPGAGTHANANVTIPCGVGVILDVPLVSLGVLIVKGTLRVHDSPSLPRVDLAANFIIVHGRLSAGTPTSHFSRRLVVTLMPNRRFNRAQYMLTSPYPAGPLHPRNLGHKALAVVGGQLHLHGMPGGGNTPSWVRLRRTVLPGQRQLYVDGDVSDWPVGATVVVSSTSNKMNDAEQGTITRVSTVGSTHVITLQSNLRRTHLGETISDGFGGTVDIRAEVGLLNRNIVIQGADEPAPNRLDGGHVIIYMTRTPQVIEGVQFSRLGHQGVLGHYPLHFHVCRDDAYQSVVTKNVILHSKQRCIVLHATSRVNVFDNFAYESRGHCFIVEEGSETLNVFKRNLGISIRAVFRLIPSSSPNRVDQHTDKQPAVFWMANPQQSFIDNAVGGSEDSGFWMELNTHMRGLSALLPYLNQSNPISYNFGTYSGNVIHSCVKFGFRTYPHGSNPRKGSIRKNRETTVILKNFLVYGIDEGMFFLNSRRTIIDSSVFVGNGVSVDVNRNSAVYISNSRFIAHYPGVPCSLHKNPTATQSVHGQDLSSLLPPLSWEPPGLSWADSRPIGMGNNGSSPLPLSHSQHTVAVGYSDTDGGRGTTFGNFNIPVGVTLSQLRPDKNIQPNGLLNCKFHGFGQCSAKSRAVVLAVNKIGGFWSTALNVKGLHFSPSTIPFWASPQSANPQDPRGVQLARFYALRDRDGSVMGTPGYIVAPFAPILPPAPIRAKLCSHHPLWSAYSCPGLCYRSLVITYREPNNRNNTVRGHVVRPYSYATITRIQDGQSFPVWGSDNVYAPLPPTYQPQDRVIATSLLSGYSYAIRIKRSRANWQFYPRSVEIWMMDWGGCSGQVKLLVHAPNANTQWIVNGTETPRIACGLNVPNQGKSYFNFKCRQKMAVLSLSVGSSARRKVASLQLIRVATRACNVQTCP